jgi:hypothetical protein
LKTTPSKVDLVLKWHRLRLNFNEISAVFLRFALSGKIKPHRNGTGDALSDLRGRGHMPALEAVLMAARGSPVEAFNTVEAEFATAASNSRIPEKARLATDEFYAESCLLLRCQRLGAYGSSHMSAFQEEIECWESQRDFLRPFGKPDRCRIDLPASEPDNNPVCEPDDPSLEASRPIATKPLPRSMIPDLEKKFKSLEAGLTRKEQFDAVRKSTEFARYHLTEKDLRQAAKSVPVPLGRPRKKLRDLTQP